MFHNLKSQRTLDNSTLELRLDIMNKNILYITHRIDTMVATLDTVTHFMSRINKQLDFEGKFGKSLDEFVNETSPQTDSDEQ